MKKLETKKIAREKTRLTSDHYKIIMMVFLLVFFVFSAVTIFLYEPSSDNSSSTKSDALDEKGYYDTYGTDEEEIEIDTSGGTCDKSAYNKLIKSASKIKVYYENAQVKTGSQVIDMTDGYDPDNPIYVDEVTAGFTVTIQNIPDNVSISIKNDYNDVTYDVNSTNIKNNTYTFDDYYAKEKVVKFTYEVKSTLDGCNQVVRKFTVNMPKINVLAMTGICEGNDSDQCQLNSYAEIDDDQYFEVKTKTTTSTTSVASGGSSSKKKTFISKPAFTAVNVFIISFVIIFILLIDLFVFIRIMDHVRRVKNEKFK